VSVGRAAEKPVAPSPRAAASRDDERDGPNGPRR
jgi:hypothetical protein